jgi:hypothetical protein
LSWFYEPLAKVNVSEAVAWIRAIPFEAWPQQHRLADGKIRPAMVSDINWRGFGNAAWPVVQALGYNETNAYQLMLSVIMPGHSIEPHRDEQPANWLYRVHVPLLTNTKAYTKMGGKRINMKVGQAYQVNTREEHALTNGGLTPRVHFMFDVRG